MHALLFRGSLGGWYYLRDGGSVGPATSNRLLELLDDGTVSRETLLWREGNPDWRPLDVSLGLTSHVPPPLPGITASTDALSLNKVSEAIVAKALSVSAYSDSTPHPWRRYFARMLDTLVGSAVMFFCIGVVLVAIDQDAYKSFMTSISGSDNRYLSTFLGVAIAMIPNALFIGLTGSSLGKLIFGVSVTRLDGRPIGLRAAFHREMMVWFRGLGVGFPLISIFTLITAFKTLKNDQKTSWDRDLTLRTCYRPATSSQMLLDVFGVLVFFGVVIALAAIG